MSNNRTAGQVVDELGQSDQLLGEMRGKLGNVCVETEDAATSIMAALSEVDNRIQEMLEFLDQTGRAEAVVELLDQADVREARMEESRQLLSMYKKERERDGEDSKQHLDDIQMLVAALDRAVDQVRDITRHTGMLAFNAAIEAAYAGDAGMGFTVVASEVKQLTMASDQASAEIQDGIAALGRAVKLSIQAMVGERLDSERAEIDVISSSIAELIESLGEFVGHQHNVLEKTRQESDLIAKSITDLIGVLQFQDVTRQQLEQVSGAVTSLAKYNGLLKSYVGGDGQIGTFEKLEVKIEEMYGQYVRAQQREVHNAVVGVVLQENAAPLIELF
jgi:methyl-accepting chemotaxis protein